MKHSFYYVLFFFFVFAIHDLNTVYCLRRVEKPGKQAYMQESTLDDYQEDSGELKSKNKNKKSKSKEKAKAKVKQENYDILDESHSVEFTLPEIQMDNSHKIDFYYPYFYKTHIIEYQDNINYETLTNECRDYGCQWCDNTTRTKCSECRHGFFQYEDNCYTSCPQGYVADVFKHKCTVQTEQSKLIFNFK